MIIKKIDNLILHKFENASFIGGNNIRVVLDSNNKIQNLKPLKRDKNIEEVSNINTEIYLANIFLFTDHWGDKNINHWFIEQFPVLLFLFELIIQFPDIKIILNKNRRESVKNNIKEVLFLVPGVKEENIYEIEIKNPWFTSIKSDNIFIGDAMRCGPYKIIKYWNLVCSKSDIVNNIKATNKKEFSKKIYLSRRITDTNSRVLTNIEEVSKVIVEKGYQEVFMENLSINDKIYLFNNCSDIITELGAGMINFIFCNNNTNLIVLMQESNKEFYTNFFKPIILQKNMNVKIIYGETIHNKNHKGHRVNTPWKLSLDEMLLNLVTS